MSEFACNVFWMRMRGRKKKMKAAVYKVTGCSGSQVLYEIYGAGTLKEARRVAREGKSVAGRAGLDGYSLQNFMRAS